MESIPPGECRTAHSRAQLEARQLRVEVQSPAGPVAVYVLHAASVRPGQQQDRDTMLNGIAEQVASDAATALVVVGDFNAPSTDPSLAALRAEADWARPTDGTLGFTWPAAFPLAGSTRCSSADSMSSPRAPDVPGTATTSPR